MLTLIDSDGNNCGNIDRDTALYMAESKDLDLVLIAPQARPPVAKIMDYGKYRYEKQRKERAARQNQQASVLKEIRLSPVIDIGDFNTRLKQARKLKVNIKFKGRQMAHKDLGFEVMNRFWKDLEDIATQDSKPKMDGRNIIMMLSKTKEDK